MNQLPNIEKIFREDDDLDFTPTVGSNLAAIFGTPQKVVQDVNSSLRYASPKQPIGGRDTPQTVSSSKTEVIIAKAVHAFKLQNGQYVSVGKLGLALTGNITTKQYQIILYKGKQDHVSIVTITPDFKYTVQANNYSSYYDGNKDNWSILFESNEASTEFAREIGLSRYFSRQGKMENSVVYQDLTAVDKDSTAKEGDFISIKYVTSIDMIQPMKVASIAMQTMPLEISKDDNWERLLIGTSVGLKRIMILPPNKQIGLGPGYPKDRDIALEIELISITTPEEQSPAAAKPTVSSGKAAIISRMAKMGKSMLPKLPASTTTDSEDTEDEVFCKSPRHKRTEPSGSPLQKKQLHLNQVTESQTSNKMKPLDAVPSTVSLPHRPVISQAAFAPQWPQNQIQPQYVTIDGQMYPVQQQAIAQPIPAALDPTLNVFLSETRTQNAEIRMGMSKISDNVQRLLDKFHVFEVQNASTPMADKTMETTLRMLLELNKSKETMYDVEKRNPITPDQNLIRMNQELNDRVILLESDLKLTKESLIGKTESISKIEQEKNDLLQSNTELKDRIQQLEKSLEEIRSELEESSKSSKLVRQLETECQEKNSKLEHRISELTAKCEKLENVALNAKQNYDRSPKEKEKEIKLIMNEAYQTLQTSFTGESYSTDFIKKTIASTIRNVTLKVLAEANHKEKEVSTDLSKPNGNESLEKSESKAAAVNECKTDEAAITLPDFTTPLIVTTNQDEPPPIPPMDLDAEDEW